MAKTSLPPIRYAAAVAGPATAAATAAAAPAPAPQPEMVSSPVASKSELADLTPAVSEPAREEKELALPTVASPVAAPTPAPAPAQEKPAQAPAPALTNVSPLVINPIEKADPPGPRFRTTTRFGQPRFACTSIGRCTPIPTPSTVPAAPAAGPTQRLPTWPFACAKYASGIPYAAAARRELASGLQRQSSCSEWCARWFDAYF
jgi:hypothetical protein